MLLKSRKDNRALIGFLVTIVVAIVGKWLDLSTAQIVTVTASVVTIATALILGIAHEDNGLKQNPNAVNQIEDLVEKEDKQ